MISRLALRRRVTTLEGAPRPQSNEDGGGKVGRTRREEES